MVRELRQQQGLDDIILLIVASCEMLQQYVSLVLSNSKAQAMSL